MPSTHLFLVGQTDNAALNSRHWLSQCCCFGIVGILKQTKQCFDCPAQPKCLHFAGKSTYELFIYSHLCTLSWDRRNEFNSGKRHNSALMRWVETHQQCNGALKIKQNKKKSRKYMFLCLVFQLCEGWLLQHLLPAVREACKFEHPWERL